MCHSSKLREEQKELKTFIDLLTQDRDPDIGFLFIAYSLK